MMMGGERSGEPGLAHSLATFVARTASGLTDCLPRGKPQTLQRVTHTARSRNGWMDGWDDRGKISLMIPFGKNGRGPRCG